MTSPYLRWLCLAFALSASPLRAEEENARLRVLLVLDTDDVGGATWGRDGTNMKALLEASFRKQKLADRTTIDVFVGQQVTPEKLLAYYRTLKIEANDGLLFYYSGHGGFHLNKGHFLALTHGKLYRNDLIAAMETGNPRLCVLLTDCCSNYSGGALATEPKGATESPRDRNDTGSQPAARREEPKGREIALRIIDPRRIQQPARPSGSLNPGTFAKAKVEEPAGEVVALRFKAPRNARLAKREEPPLAPAGSGKFAANRALPTLTTDKGKVPMRDILDASDGEVVRHLFFRHSGIVDINGCTKGDSSFGHIAWGGSLFTNTLIALQKAKASDYDANGNHVVEWSEFFPRWQRSTNEAGSHVGGRERVRQIPEATKLGTPIVP